MKFPKSWKKFATILILTLGLAGLILLTITVTKKGVPTSPQKKLISCEQVLESDAATPGDTRYLPPDIAILPTDTEVCGTNTIQGLTYFTSKLKESEIFAFYSQQLTKMGCAILGQATPDINSEISNSLNFRCNTGFGYILTYKQESKYAALFNTTGTGN